MSDPLTKNDQRHADEAVSSFFRNAVRDPPSAVKVTKFVRDRVNTYLLGDAQITYLFEVTIAAVESAAHARGLELGRELEKQQNPALRGFGQALAETRKADRAAIRNAMQITFEKLTETGSNPYAGFYEAIKSIE